MRKKRKSHETRLSACLRGLMERERITIKAAAEIAQCPPSVFHGWLTGAYPAENIGGLKRLCDHFGIPLAVALTGQPDVPITAVGLAALFTEEDVFTGLARVKITRLSPRSSAVAIGESK